MGHPTHIFHLLPIIFRSQHTPLPLENNTHTNKFILISSSLVILAGERFVPDTYESGYKITMRLTINDVDAQDFGSYRCVAKNSLGDTDGAIKLYRKY